MRSNQVIKSHQRSNLGQTCQKRVKSGCLVQLYAIYICFDLEFGRELKFKIIWGQIRSLKVLRGCPEIIIRPILVKDSVQNWLILKISLSLAKTFGIGQSMYSIREIDGEFKKQKVYWKWNREKIVNLKGIPEKEKVILRIRMWIYS